MLSYTGRGTCCFFNRYIFSIAVCVWIYRYVLGFCCLADGAGVCLYSLRCTCGLESYFSFIKAVFRKGKLYCERLITVNTCRLCCSVGRTCRGSYDSEISGICGVTCCGNRLRLCFSAFGTRSCLNSAFGTCGGFCDYP